MAGLFKAVGAILDSVTTIAEVVNTTAIAGLSLAQGAEASAVQYRNQTILNAMEELGLSTGNQKEDLALWQALRQEERELLFNEAKKPKVKAVAP
jgi:hypothetical protein